MAQTAQAQVQDMIERATRLGDDVLASEIRAFAASRQFGLVFEHNRPERMRLYGKIVSVGDVVQTLPERGKPEGGSQLLWRVDALDGETAQLSAFKSNSYSDNNSAPCMASLDDIVAVAEYDQPIYAGLREVDRVERGGNKPYQVVINGENYHALESLLFCYAGKVDCIYIDPPYNTGAKDWKYNNDYVDGSDEYRHSKWLAFIERRLKLAKRLLNPRDSVLIVTIDEKEYFRLGLLLEQVFSEADIEMVTSVINARGKQRTGKFARTEEYIFFVKFGAASVHLEDDPDYQEGASVPWRTMRRSSLAGARGKHGAGACGPNQFFPVYVSDDGKIVGIGKSLPENKPISSVSTEPGITAVFPIRDDGTEMNWGITDGLAQELWRKGYIRVGRHKPRKPQKWELSYLTSGKIADIETGKAKVVGRNPDGSVQAVYIENKKKAPASVWVRASHNAETEGTNLLKSIFVNDSRFTYPKSLYAVRDSLALFIDDKPDALVVDFFAGSGTTLHAVNLMNAEDNGNRQCICITNNEISAEEAKKFTAEGLRQGDSKWEERGIARYVTWPRTKCSIEGIDVTGGLLKGGYLGSRTPMANGFKENAIFFDLTYQNPDAVELGAAFEEIAPLLWLRAGARGSMIKHEEQGYAIADAYAVLFEYSYVQDLVRAVRSTPKLSCVYIVTDDSTRFASVKKELGSMECVRLYESYLRSFRIAAEDAVR